MYALRNDWPLSGANTLAVDHFCQGVRLFAVIFSGSGCSCCTQVTTSAVPESTDVWSSCEYGPLTFAAVPSWTLTFG